jgi:hypothetical protein
MLGLAEGRELLVHPPCLSRHARIPTAGLALIRARPSGTHSSGFRFTSSLELSQLIPLSPSSQVGRRLETLQCIIRSSRLGEPCGSDADDSQGHVGEAEHLDPVSSVYEIK